MGPVLLLCMAEVQRIGSPVVAELAGGLRGTECCSRRGRPEKRATGGMTPHYVRTMDEGIEFSLAQPEASAGEPVSAESAASAASEYADASSRLLKK